MIDIQLLRKDPEGVAKRLAARGAGAFDAVLFQRYESTRKDLQSAVEQAQASRNRIAKDIGQAKAKGQDVAPLLEQGEKLKALLEKSEVQLTALQVEIQEFLKRVPNIPHESAPLGQSAQVRLSGKRPRRRRRGVGRARLRHRRQDRGQPLRGDARRGGAPAPRARAVHA